MPKKRKEKGIKNSVVKEIEIESLIKKENT